MARTLSADLLTAQQATQRKPAIRILINDVDYSDRLLFLEHHEEPYRDYATIILSNSDRGLDDVATEDNNLTGYRFRIAYGYYTGQTVAEPNGDGAGNEYVDSADLWVKSQQMISSPGQLVCVLYCEGQWAYLREQRVMALPDPSAIEVFDPSKVTDDPYFISTFEGTKSVYSLIESVLESAMGWTLDAAPATDDGILTDFSPHYSLEELPYAAAVLRDLIMMTKCYLRPKANLTWEIVYPQDTDTVDESFYSYQSPYFLEYAEKTNLITPNRIIVFAGNPDKLTVWPEPIIVGDSGAYIGNYDEVKEPTLAWTITSQTDADNRAEAIKTRYQAELQAGYLIVYHDARVELYDKVQVFDSRGRA